MLTPLRVCRSILPVALLAFVVPLAGAARATFPGNTNGRIVYAFQSTSNKCPDVFTINPDGSGKTKLTNCPGVASDPSWNAAGSMIAFASTTQEAPNGGPGPLEIYTMNGDGTGKSQVTNDSVEDDDPSFDNTGSTIVEGRTRSGPDTQDIATVSATGGTPVTLLAGSAGGEADEPEFSPDGTKIAFQKRTGPSYDIFTMNADGSNQVDLTPNTNSNEEFASWSPDGTKVAFASDRGGIFQIFTMNADGSNVQQITTQSSTPDIQPVWSPDGTKIAFTRGCDNDNCQGQNGPQNGDIFVVDVTNLAAPGTPSPLVQTSNPEYDADWGVPCTSDCGPTSVLRTVSLALSGHLKATGQLTDQGGQNPPCDTSQKVKIQRKSGSSWKTVKTATTDGSGRYSQALPNVSGKYRALAPSSTAAGGSLACAQATSSSRSYAATHARSIPFFGLGAFATGMFANGILKAQDRFDPCTTHQPVLIQKASGSSWVTLAKSLAQSSGKDGEARFGNNIAKRNGTYRAYAPKEKLGSGDICGAATSKSVRYPIG